MKIYWNGESKNIIGSRLKELRQQQNIFQRILAARLTLSGVEFNDLTILRIEKGERFVPDYEIAVIADYFKVSADYLLGALRTVGHWFSKSVSYSPDVFYVAGRSFP